MRICVSDSREDEVDDEQVYQDVKGIIEAVKVIISGTTIDFMYI